MPRPSVSQSQTLNNTESTVMTLQIENPAADSSHANWDFSPTKRSGTAAGRRRSLFEDEERGRGAPRLDSSRRLTATTLKWRETKTLHRRRDTVTGAKYINNYRVLKEIGRGACGKVKLALNEHRRLVAIKQVRRAEENTRLGGPSEAQKKFQGFMHEVAIMKTLRHTNIVSVYEVIDDPTADKIYLVMQYVPGGAIATLKVVDSTDNVCTPIAPDLLVGYARQILAGLHYLHRHNVVHRDIKPDNILMDNGHVYLADFGVAEAFDTAYRERMHTLMQESMARSMAMSVAGAPAGGPQVLGKKGTLLFIAPELWLGSTASGRAVDMWAVGVTLYTLLTGRLPFRNPEEITDPNKPRIPTEYGEEWARLLEGLLCHNPTERLAVHEARGLVKRMLRSRKLSPEVEEQLRQQREAAAHLRSAADILGCVCSRYRAAPPGQQGGTRALTENLPPRGRRPFSLYAILQDMGGAPVAS